jgi:hypothetical protein
MGEALHSLSFRLITALPFVISTEAKRSGEISVWMLFPGNVFLAKSEI